MKHVTKRINERIKAYQRPGEIRKPVLPAGLSAEKDFQVSLRLHQYLLVRLDFLAANAQMTRSQLMLEMLQDVAEDILEEMDPDLKKEMDEKINASLYSKD